MSKQVCVVLLVSGVFSCCTPNQWEGIQGMATGYVQDGKPFKNLHLLEALFNVSLDAMSKKVRVSGSINIDGKQMDQFELLDYSMMPAKQYIVMGGKCFKSDLNGSFPQTCLSSAAKMVVSSYVGVGMNKIMVNVYSDMIDGKMTNITVTKDSCIPITTTQTTGCSVTFNDFMGITLGIKNMSVFDVPKICMNDENSSPVHHQKNIRSSAFLHHFK